MANLLQIEEPLSKQKKSDDLISSAVKTYAIGIDLGTTNSVVACASNGTARILSDDHGHKLQPSIVALTRGQLPLIGMNAKAILDAEKDKNKNTLSTDGGNASDYDVITSSKRLMGALLSDDLRAQFAPIELRQDDPSKPITLHTQSGVTTPIHIASLILEHMQQIAATSLLGDGHHDGSDRGAGDHHSIKKAVITVPAYFDDAARQATKDAATMAGIEVLRLINEPTAAALAYGLDQNAEGVYAVYDLGGGTFDVSILAMQMGVFKVLSTKGNTQLGGDDFDQRIIDWIKQNADHKPYQDRSLRAMAKSAKEALSKQDQINLSKDLGFGYDGDLVLTRAVFDDLTADLIQKTVDLMQDCMQDAGLDATDLDGVVLVGGSTRMPIVKKALSTFFDGAIYDDHNPDTVVAMGAALQAETLVSGSGSLLLDVTPLSLGIEMMGGVVEKIIHRNSPIPTRKAQNFTTSKNNQTALLIHVVQGEREMVDDCRSLARFELRNIPPLPAGLAEIQVMFALDADGLLTVTATEKTQNKSISVEVKPSYGIDITDIQTMLMDSHRHAKRDMQVRLLSESKSEANRIIEAIRVSIQNEDWDKMDTSGDMIGLRKNLEDAIIALENMLQEKESVDMSIEDLEQQREAIEKQSTHLASMAQPIAEQKFNQMLDQTIKGQSLDDIDT